MLSSSLEKLKQLPLMNMNRKYNSKDYAELVDEVTPSPSQNNIPMSPTKSATNTSTTTSNQYNVSNNNHSNSGKVSINLTNNTNANGNFDYQSMKGTKSKKLKKLMLQHVGYRLSKRKELHVKRRKIADIMFGLGVLGILLMIWLIELNFSEQHQHLVMRHKMTGKFQYWNQSEASIIIKFLITLSTSMLLCLVFIYHHLDIKIYCIDNTIDNWRIALTPTRLFFIASEFLVCMIHPIPSTIILNWSTESIQTISANNMTEARVDQISDSVPLDILLGVPMFARLYLFCRLVLLHSRLVTDASSQSLGYLNRINFNFRFVFKAYMSQSPEKVLTLITMSLFMIASWSLKACEYHVDAEKFGLLNSMWLVAITFLTVGYGDFYPNTYCGRTISVLSGLFGVFCTALLVALISRKLEFTRAEKYVYQFVNEVELKKELHRAAANVIKQGWMIYRLRKPNQTRNANNIEQEIIRRQRKFLVDIQKVRKIQQEERKINDNAVTTLELFRQQSDIAIITQKLFKICENLERKVSFIEDKMESLDMNLRSVQDMVGSSKNK